MPYTPAQLRKFFAMEKRGEKTPADFRKYARGKSPKKRGPAKRKR